MAEILSVKSDFLFKLIFGDKRNVDILSNFLAAILGMPREDFAELQILDSSLKKESEKDKLGILDVNVRMANGTLINIEIQIIGKSDFGKRVVYYTSKRLVEQLKEGESYGTLARTISINIIDFNLFPFEKYHSTFWLKEETEGVVLTDVVQIDFLELRKARKLQRQPESENPSEKQLWMDFINAESKEELDMLATKNEVFKRPVAEVVRLSASEAIRAEYDARVKAERDRMAEMKFAREQGIELGIERGIEQGIELGIERGIEQGRMEEKRGMVMNLIRIGLPYEEISKASGIPISEIDAFVSQSIAR